MNTLDEIKQIETNAVQLYNENQVEAAIDTMAEKINLLLADLNPVLLTVLNGGIITAGKLLPRLNFPLTIDAINACRYRNEIRGGEIEWILKPSTPLTDRTVLIVDDILDEGLTLEAICQYCRKKGAVSIYIAVLVDKILDRSKPVKADFIGLQTGNYYLFGYGMDYKGYLRNAPGIYACKN